MGSRVRPDATRRNPTNITILARRAAKRSECVKPVVAPEVIVMDAQSESDHIEVGNHRAKHARDPNSLWRAGAVKTGSYAEGCNPMRERRSHPTPFQQTRRISHGPQVFHRNPRIKMLTRRDLGA